MGAFLCGVARDEGRAQRREVGEFRRYGIQSRRDFGIRGNLGFCADSWGRKPVTIAWFAISWILTGAVSMDTPTLLGARDVRDKCDFFARAVHVVLHVAAGSVSTRMRATATSFVSMRPGHRFLGPLVAGH